MKICSTKLTTCGVRRDGRAVTLDLIDETGTELSLELPFDQAQAVAMTLPSLLTPALKSLTGSTTARYVFPLDHWLVEQSDDRDHLFLTLATTDGFQVSFGISSQTCRALGSTLAGNSGQLAAQDGCGDETEPASVNALN